LAEVIKHARSRYMAVVIDTFKPSSEEVSSLDAEGEQLTLDGDEIEEFHYISPETDPDGMRVVGALGEMLFEQAKDTFKAESMFVAIHNEDFNLIMFPKGNRFIVWKTKLSIEEALEKLRSDRDR
jgi:hypothetical protein